MSGKEKYLNLAKLTVKNIKRRKLRSILTVISVIIGIATIVSLFLVSDGLFNYIEDIFLNVGINTIFILPLNLQDMHASSGGMPKISEEIKLTENDLRLLERIPEIDFVLGFSYKITKVEHKNENFYEMVILMDPKQADKTFEMMNVEIREGKSLQAREGYEVVIGPYISDKMFKNKLKVGQKIKINNKDFKIIGILESMGNAEADSQIFIPNVKAKELFEIKNFDSVYASVKEGEDPLEVKDEIKKSLEKVHGKDKLMIVTAKQILMVIKYLISFLKIILVSIGLISIIVGSVGIINSIFTSVIERTKEIGILKSLGARKQDIYFIFIFESLLLSLIGGIIGLGIGIGIAMGVKWYAATQGFVALKIVLSWQIFALAFGISLIVGVIAGYLPSRNAAKMNVVEALRKTV